MYGKFKDSLKATTSKKKAQNIYKDINNIKINFKNHAFQHEILWTYHCEWYIYWRCHILFYLGSKITTEGDSMTGIQAWITKSTGVFNCREKILKISIYQHTHKNQEL